MPGAVAEIGADRFLHIAAVGKHRRAQLDQVGLASLKARWPVIEKRATLLFQRGCGVASWDGCCGDGHPAPLEAIAM